MQEIILEVRYNSDDAKGGFYTHNLGVLSSVVDILDVHPEFTHVLFVSTYTNSRNLKTVGRVRELFEMNNNIVMSVSL